MDPKRDDLRELLSLDASARLAGDRLPFGHPRVDLATLPLAFAVAWLVSATSFGQVALIPFQIQFHELGHAIPAWLSGRAALPLPFGFTFWSAHPSLFTTACLTFLIGVFGYRAYVEDRRFALGIALGLLALETWFHFALTPHESERIVLLGGIAGELLVSTLVLVAFYFPFPDRLRWDFFRFVFVLPAAFAWVSAVRLWLGVRRGTTPLPTGSILGTTGDGSGDLDRLIADHGMSSASITHLYVTLAGVTAFALFAIYALFAVRAIVARRSTDDESVA